MAINNQFTEPGVFSQFRPTTALPVLPGGIRIAALIGAGRTTNIVNGETVTKGSLNGSDSLANTATSLSETIVDEDFNTYILDQDYQLTTGAVDWSITTPAAITGTTSETFDFSTDQDLKVTIAGGAEQTITIGAGGSAPIPASPGAATAAEVAAQINATATGFTASDDGGSVKLETDDGDNSDILIGDGDANATLGFTAGAFQQTPREPAVGKTYTVSYEYAKSSADYVPRFFFNMADVIAEHGEVSTTNTLSLGAEIVFQQGASAVALVQTDPADGPIPQQFRDAIDKLAPVEGINIIVPLSTDTTLYSFLENHVDIASSVTERKERTAIVGQSGSPTVQDTIAIAGALNNKRMVLVHPTSATRIVGDSTATLDGSFLAAAIAGVRTSREFDVADPLTRKELVGFDSVPDTLLRAEKNLLTSKGVLVIDTVAASPRVRHGVTTDPSTVENREYSVVETIDFVGSSMRQTLEAIFIGQKILADTPSQVRSIVTAMLNDLQNREIITAFDQVQADINVSDATQIDVSFRVSPVFPLNFILITFSLITTA